MATAPQGPPDASLDALRQAWRTLSAVADQYQTNSAPFASLIEARRLIEVEIRAQGHPADVVHALHD